MMAMAREPTTGWSELVAAAYALAAPERGEGRIFDQYSEEAIMTVAHDAVVAYVNDPGLCSDDEDEFPSRSLLVGLYVVDRVADHGVRGGRRRMLISCACLGREVTDDVVPYLGLDVRVSAPLEGGALRVDRVDSFVL